MDIHAPAIGAHIQPDLAFHGDARMFMEGMCALVDADPRREDPERRRRLHYWKSLIESQRTDPLQVRPRRHGPDMGVTL